MQTNTAYKHRDYYCDGAQRRDWHEDDQHYLRGLIDGIRLARKTGAIWSRSFFVCRDLPD